MASSMQTTYLASTPCTPGISFLDVVVNSPSVNLFPEDALSFTIDIDSLRNSFGLSKQPRLSAGTEDFTDPFPAVNVEAAFVLSNRRPTAGHLTSEKSDESGRGCGALLGLKSNSLLKIRFRSSASPLTYESGTILRTCSYDCSHIAS